MEKEIKEKLLSSPLFHLSLSSKELFHSNFLAWIGKQYPDLFVAIFKELGCHVKWQSQKWHVKREHLNFDLCVEDDKHISLVLENNVKGIPRKHQLGEYVDKLKPGEEDDLVLLSLATEFPDKEVIREKWKIVNYNDLYIALNKHKKQLEKEPYHLALIEDYCQFIQCLHELAQSWRVDDQDPFLPTKADKEFCQELRIGDLQDKMRYSQLFVKLNEGLEKYLHVQTISGLDIEGIKKEKPKPGSDVVYTNWGFTHGQGLLEAKVKINNDYVLLVQLQGNRYCHGIEWISKDSATHEEYWKCTSNDEFIKKLSLFQFDNNRVEFPSVCDNDTPTKERKRKGEKPRNYNKYGNRFLYQSQKILESATVEDVINAIKDDIEKMIFK